MSEINLKEYTTRLKDLEIAIFTQEHLMEEHKKVFENQKPTKPQKTSISKPYEPSHPDNESPLWLAGIIIFAIVAILGLLLLTPKDGGLGKLIGVLFLFGGGFMHVFSIVTYFTSKREYKSSLKNYETNMHSYRAQLNEYHKQITKIDNSYIAEMEIYRSKSNKYNSNVAKTMLQHNNALSSLKKSIQSVYDENIIFPKYRNLVAITALNEYLLSGRCDKLEGPDGAYNLYEMELRQNIIISQLSSIIDNLEEIKSNQFSLYHELKKSRSIIEDILAETKEINESAKLTAYFTKVTALAEISPKVYHSF